MSEWRLHASDCMPECVLAADPPTAHFAYLAGDTEVARRLLAANSAYAVAVAPDGNLSKPIVIETMLRQKAGGRPHAVIGRGGAQLLNELRNCYKNSTGDGLCLAVAVADDADANTGHITALLALAAFRLTPTKRRLDKAQTAERRRAGADKALAAVQAVVERLPGELAAIVQESPST